MLKKIILITLTGILLLSLISCKAQQMATSETEMRNTTTIPANNKIKPSLTPTHMVINTESASLYTPTSPYNTLTPTEHKISDKLQENLNKVGDNDLVCFGIYLNSDAVDKTKVRFKNQTGINAPNWYMDIDEVNREKYLSLLAEEMKIDIIDLFENFYNTKVDLNKLPNGGKVSDGWREPFFSLEMNKSDIIKISKEEVIIRMVGESECRNYPY